MPLTKKPYKKKVNKQKIPKKNLTKGQVKRVATTIAKKVINQNIETKRIYFEAIGQPLTIVSVPDLLTTMNQGVGINEGVQDNRMVGSKCKLTSLWIRYSLFQDVGTTTTNATSNVRLIVVQDLDQNTVAPTLQGQLFENGFTLPIVANYNTDNVPTRFRILYDKTISMNVVNQPNYVGTITLKEFPKETLEFVGNPFAPGSIGTGHVYFYSVSDATTIADAPQITMQSAFYYKDA